MRWCLLLFLLVLPARAEPGVAVLLDSRKSDQVEVAGVAKKCLYSLMKANELSNLQFTIFTADFADRATVAQWGKEHQVTPADLPALAFFTRNGNKLVVENLLRRFYDPVDAAEGAFRCLSAYLPQVKDCQVHTGVCVNSTPEGATLKLDGHDVGVTHCDVPLQPGLHILELRHDDFVPFDQTVTVQLGQIVSLNVTLAPQLAQLIVESKGPPLSVTVDEQAAAQATPVSLNLTAGSHHVKASAPGYYEVDGDVTLAGEKVTRVSMTPVEQKLRLGWAGIKTTGYTSYSNNPLPLPIPRSSQIFLSEPELNEHITRALALRPKLRVVTAGACDCALSLEIRGTSGAIQGQIQLMDPQGTVTLTLTAERDMPFMTMDEQGSASKRAQEVADELLNRALDNLIKTVHPSNTAPEDETPAIQVVVEELKVP